MFSARSFLPHILGNDYWDIFDYPSSIFDQDFGTPSLGFDYDPLGFDPNLNTDLMPFTGQTGGQVIGNVHDDQNNFQVKLNCKQFKPEEVNVTVNDQNHELIIKGKHEERSDPHGCISREFTRRYVLPEGVQLDNVHCSWSNRGILTCMVPKHQQQHITDQGRRVPINVPMSGRGQRYPLRHSIGHHGGQKKSADHSMDESHKPITRSQDKQQPDGKQTGGVKTHKTSAATHG